MSPIVSLGAKGEETSDEEDIEIEEASSCDGESQRPHIKVDSNLLHIGGRNNTSVPKEGEYEQEPWPFEK